MTATPFSRFLAAYSVNAAGSALSAGALPLIAVLVLHVSALQVAVLAATGLVATAVLALPLGSLVDRSNIRNLMVAVNVAGFAALATVPATAAVGMLTFTHLCGVAVVQSVVSVAYVAASGAYVKALVPPANLTSASARLDTVGWLTQSAGPPAGGLLISAAGATATALADALSYLASAVMLGRCPSAPHVGASTAASAGVLGGWWWIFGHPGLRLLYINAMVFGGAVMWTSPLMAVRLLQDLHATPLQYGLALGVPCLGGVVGAVASPWLAARVGQHRLLIIAGAARAPWLVALPFLDSVYTVMACETLLLLSAGLFNPLFAAFRMSATPQHLMGRVVAAWAMGSKTIQPLFMLVGGVVAAVWSTRGSLLLAGMMCLVSVACLPGTKRLAACAEPAPA